MPADEILSSGNADAVFVRAAVALGSAFAFLGIALGAFGAHSLRESLGTDGTMIFETGVRYQMYHAIALIMTGLLARTSVGTSSTLRLSLVLFVLGIVLFSGSLYVLALAQFRWIGFVTPLGGLAFLGGWAAMFYAVLRYRTRVSAH